jgi:hypothetical protein
MSVDTFEQLSAEEKRRYNCPRSAIEMVESIKMFDTYSGLLHAHDSSFSEWRTVRTLERSGRCYQRMSKVRQKWMLDLEIKADGYIGELVPVVPEEAFREQQKR